MDHGGDGDGGDGDGGGDGDDGDGDGDGEGDIRAWESKVGMPQRMLRVKVSSPDACVCLCCVIYDMISCVFVLCDI